MATLNNVHVDVLEQVAKDAQIDRAKVRRSQQLEGQWLLEEGAPQFRAQVSYEGGKIVLEADQPRNLGGGGSRPGPLHYCFFGLLACYTATFAATASTLGIRLRKLSARLEARMNFSRGFGLSQEPVMEEIAIALSVESDAPREKLQEVARLAYERCPAVYALTQPVALKTRLEVVPAAGK